MFQRTKKIKEMKDIRSKLLYLLGLIFVARLGSQIPVPGVDAGFFGDWLAQNIGNSFNFFDAMTGGSFESMSLFALGITPYITASIIVQLLTIAIPALEEMQKDGGDGREKLEKITRYSSVGLALLESIAMTIGFGRQGLIPDITFGKGFLAVLCLTCGSAFLVWLGERATEKKVGNGISLILVINIVSRIPADMNVLFQNFVLGKSIAQGILATLVIVAVLLGVTLMVLVLEGAHRSILVQYSQKLPGRSYAGRGTEIPLKVNTAGVIPIIFASSIMSMPEMIARLVGSGEGTGLGWEILRGLSSSNWCDVHRPWYSWGMVLYILLVVFFAYFYTSITFNPLEVADNIKNSGGTIPGIRPGRPTSEYLQKVLNGVIPIGAAGLAIVCLIPILANGVFGANVSFGGTSLIIVAGVVLETAKQWESQMIAGKFKGFLHAA